MSAPRPGFARAFVPHFTRALKSALPPKKAIILILALAVPPLLTLPVAGDAPWGRGTALVAIVVFLYLQLLVPLAGLLFGTAVLLDEEGAGNLPYLFTRPAPRSALVLARLTAFALLGSVALGASLLATFLLSAGAAPPDGFGGRAAMAVLLSFPAYLAFFTLLAGFTRFALVGGFLYAFGVEGMLGLIPGMIRKLTILYYARSLLGGWEGRKVTAADLFGEEGPAGTGSSVMILAGVATVAVFLTLWVVRKREFAGRNPGRG